jgi:hypothetical protein
MLSLSLSILVSGKTQPGKRNFPGIQLVHPRQAAPSLRKALQQRCEQSIDARCLVNGARFAIPVIDRCKHV